MLSDAIIYLDYFGTVVFAMTGCLVAARRKQSDILAFILLGLVTAVGGGTIRDILIGRTPVFWIHNQMYLFICTVTAIMMFTGLHHLKKIKNYEFFLVWADAIGLATFTIIGTHIALMANISIMPAILLGVFTACFGGVIRDIISREDTLIFRNDIYMTASILGSVIFIIFQSFGLELMAFIFGFLGCFILRGFAIIYNLKLPGHRYFEHESK